MEDFVAALRRCHGARVVDLFAGTGMERHAKDLNIGCYVVRGALTYTEQLQWHQDLVKSMSDIVQKFGDHAIDLKGKKKKDLGRTPQSRR